MTVDNDNNVGSDSNTSIQATSSGDATFDATDNWVISCQGATGPGSACDLTADPIITFAFQGPGAIRATSVDTPGNGNDNPNFRWSGITVPAGETRAVMVFVELSDTAAHAQADAAFFNSNASLQGAGYLGGLTPLQQSEVVNFIINPTPVPTLTQWAQASMAALLGIAGVVSAGLFGRRRRRAAGRTAAGLALGLLALGMGAPGAFATPVGQTCAVELRQMCGNQTGACAASMPRRQPGQFLGGLHAGAGSVRQEAQGRQAGDPVEAHPSGPDPLRLVEAERSPGELKRFRSLILLQFHPRDLVAMHLVRPVGQAERAGMA